MNLDEYWKEYVLCWAAPIEGDIPTELAPFVYAGFHAGLSPQQLLNFHIQFLKARDVSSRLAIRTLKPETLERIDAEFSSGCVYSKDVIPKIFCEHEVLEKYREIMFKQSDA